MLEPLPKFGIYSEIYRDNNTIDARENSRKFLSNTDKNDMISSAKLQSDPANPQCQEDCATTANLQGEIQLITYQGQQSGQKTQPEHVSLHNSCTQTRS